MSDLDNVRFLRLSTGEDVVAQIDELEDDNENVYFVLTSPMKALYMMTDEKNISVTLLPWVFTSIVTEQEFVIFQEDILTMAQPTDEIISYYGRCVAHYGTEEETENDVKVSVDTDLESEDELTGEVIENLKNRTLH